MKVPEMLIQATVSALFLTALSRFVAAGLGFEMVATVPPALAAGGFCEVAAVVVAVVVVVVVASEESATVVVADVVVVASASVLSVALVVVVSDDWLVLSEVDEFFSLSFSHPAKTAEIIKTARIVHNIFLRLFILIAPFFPYLLFYFNR